MFDIVLTMRDRYEQTVYIQFRRPRTLVYINKSMFYQGLHYFFHPVVPFQVSGSSMQLQYMFDAELEKKKKKKKKKNNKKQKKQKNKKNIKSLSSEKKKMT